VLLLRYDLNGELVDQIAEMLQCGARGGSRIGLPCPSSSVKSNEGMHQSPKLTQSLSSPVALIVVVWCAILIGVAVGPIAFPQQPSMAVIVLVAAGVSLFIAGDLAGAWCCRAWMRSRPELSRPPIGALNIVVVATSLLGLFGIASIVLDRIVLSGAGINYAELLRCMPTLVDVVEIRRTPLLYAGYLTFSFGSASLILFLLKGEEIKGWPAALAQLSILSPVGYALVYSGRMSILFVIVLVIAAMLVRIRQGRRALPQGHHLLIKTIAVVVLFGIYANTMWSTRRSFCSQMAGLARELGIKGRAWETEQARALKRELAEQNPAAGVQRDSVAHSVDAIDAAELSKMIAARKDPPGGDQVRPSQQMGALVVMMKESWHTSPRPYVLSAVESGMLSDRIASNLLNTSFYLGNSVFILDRVWNARTQFSPHWGIYEIGILSPIFRIFFPQSQQLLSMNTELKAANVFGFSPAVWAAAYVDFGAAGAIIYILIWGFVAGWAAYGTRHSFLTTPPLLLTFILSSILLSFVSGPLGIVNSALVLASMVVVGIVADSGSSRFQDKRAELDSETSRSQNVGAS
jgi:hypothetical protein